MKMKHMTMNQLEQAQQICFIDVLKAAQKLSITSEENVFSQYHKLKTAMKKYGSVSREIESRHTWEEIYQSITS